MTEGLGLTIAMPARAENSPRIRQALREYLNGLALGATLVTDILLAAGEATSNAIEHAYRETEGDIFLHVYQRMGRLVIEVRDRGVWSIETSSDRGRGLGIMRALVDAVSIESTKSGTAVVLEIAI
jgi:anti-sigma regulatory factor (Ser/Thr protein kinase)